MKYLIIFFCFLGVSCTVQTASKNSDLKSPCAGCEESKVVPSGNLMYKV